MTPPLPVLACREKIVAALRESRRLIVSAPPGSGKSTCIPRFFLEDAGVSEGSIIVLQPRRVAARSLAAYSARLIGEECGERIGYQVRFDSRIGPHTRLMYQTYGVFIRQLLANPTLKGIGLVVLDEFHERTVEMDLALAWIAMLQRQTSKTPAMIVMSATLEGESLVKFLDDAPLMDIPGRVFPVDISHQTAKPFETPEQQAFRALQGIVGSTMDGSMLVFMPGVGEIKSLARLCEDLRMKYRVPVFELHGQMNLNEQMAVLDESPKRPCVIIATNVAETSLTIPGVTCVIDSGLERRATYDPDRDRNTLLRGRISKHSAIQRAGRAGRVAPGRCIRLWSRETEQAMPDALSPEITRLELSPIALAAFGLLRRSGLKAITRLALPWLTDPEEQRWQHAIEALADIGAIEGTQSSPSLTELGNRLVDVPADPLPAAILVLSREHGIALISCALIALWENQDSRAAGISGNLFESALSLAHDPSDRSFSRDVIRSFESLCAPFDPATLAAERAALAGPGDGKNSPELDEILHETARCWMKPMQKRLAVREESGSRYLFADGKAAAFREPRRSEQPEAALALTVLETAAEKQGRRNLIVHYIPLRAAWITEVFNDRLTTESVCRWDDQRRSVIAEKRTLFGRLVVARQSAAGADLDPGATADLLAEKLVSGAISLMDDESRQLVCRIRCAAAAFPDKGYPAFVDDDWRLVYHELAHGRSSFRELEQLSLARAIKDYIGPDRTHALDQLAPVRIALPSGKTGKVMYFDNAPPELSARIGDLIGMKGTFAVCQGRVPGIFNILAPNYRTVQKTADLSGFWRNAYPEIKNELKRKYPRHPWP